MLADLWARSEVSVDGTHHQINGEPLYPTRYAEVLKFHAPGLAPVRDASGAYHIHPSGTPAYSERFLRSFGFYEGLAAVQSQSGWFHIRPNGARLESATFAWCGNFQSLRCPVRASDGSYFHVKNDGMAAYRQRYRYAGDFRDGIAVVQSTDGLHTHINLEGTPIHDVWFEDLDVYHKGFARARDQRGWYHIKRDAIPAYDRRFVAVEPFYNGQARAETLDGGLEIVDEHGRTVVVLRPC